MQARRSKSHLFTLRVWPEELGEGQVAWRGKIQRVMGGDTLYFHDWNAMLAFLQQTLQTALPTTVMYESKEDDHRSESDA